MNIILNASHEDAAAWDKIAEVCEPEVVAGELTTIGEFEYYVAPEGILPPGRFGGYNEQDTETGAISSLIIIGEETPPEARGPLVAHMALHLALPDDGSPHLCKSHDRFLQSKIAEDDPALLKPFYEGSRVMYTVGYEGYRELSQADQLLLDRYIEALRNSQRQGEDIDLSEQARQRLADLGLLLPDGSVALTAVDKRSGNRATISLQTEPGSRHKCRNCSHPIVKGSARVTTSAQRSHDGYDHHHYHPGCFTHIELGIFGGMHQIPHEEALWTPPQTKKRRT